MPPSLNKQSPAPPNALLWLSLTIILICVVLFSLGVGLYWAGSDKEEAFWLTILLGLPAGFYIVGLVVIYRKLQVDTSVSEFYWFCLRWMPLCLGSYTLMWGLYAFGCHHWTLQYLSLVFIAMLVIPVAAMTYAIMESVDKEEKGVKSSRRKGSARWNRLANFCRRYLLLEYMKGSASNVPYWTLLHFFTMFLVVTCLFSFAFAFHDRNILKGKEIAFKITEQSLESLKLVGVSQETIDKLRSVANQEIVGEKYFLNFMKDTIGDEQVDKFKLSILSTFSTPSSSTVPSKMPALYTQRLYASNTHEDQVLRAIPSNQIPPKSSSARGYIFYFDIGKALMNPNKDTPPKSDKIPYEKDYADKLTKYQNYQHLIALVSAINDKTSRGERVRVELRGRADDSQPRGPYPTNYAISEARARVMVSEMLKRYPDRTWTNIDWYPVALSNETQIQTSDQGPNRNISALRDVISKLSMEEGRRVDSQDLLKRQDLHDLLDDIEKLDKQRMESNNLERPDSQEIDGLIIQLRGVIMLYETSPSSRNQIKQLSDQLIDSMHHVKLPRDYKKRIVEVTLIPLREASFNTLRYERLGLMDYLIYTITGMGNIVPTTTYAKFLTSLADIIKVFFMAALFNAILSLRKYGRPRGVFAVSTPRQAFNATGGENPLNVVAPSGCDWQASSSDSWIKFPSGDKGTGSTVLIYSVEQNSNSKRRLGKITIRGFDGEQVFTVEQEGALPEPIVEAGS